MVTRRTFLRAAAWGGSTLTLASLVWPHSFAWFVDRSAARLVAIARTPAARLRAHFNYLDLDPTGVDLYFADCQRYQHGFSPRLPLGPDVYTRYLLSTDFFQHGADESRRIHYVGFFEPSVTPCTNPLARFAEPQPDRIESHRIRR
jgi:hypothetical protein